MTASLVRRLGRTTIAGELRAQYTRARKPAVVEVVGVQVPVDPAWAPAIRDRLYRGSYERVEAQVLMHTVRPDDRCYEVGAGIGLTATVACRIVGADRVTAVEADPSLVPAARATAARNGFSPEVLNAVVGDSTEPRVFHVHDQFWRSSLRPAPHTHPITVPGLVFLDELERTQATYLVADIEGAEVELLDRELPARLRAMCVEVHPRLLGHRAVQRLLTGLMDQGFVLDTQVSGTSVVHLARDLG